VLHVLLISSCLIILIILGEEYKLRNSSLCSFLHSPVTSSLIGRNILINTLFSNTCNLCSTLNVRDQVTHTYKTIGKLIVLYNNKQVLIIGLCILLRVYQLNIGITSVRNKVFFGARFYCALLTLQVSAPFGGLQLSYIILYFYILKFAVLILFYILPNHDIYLMHTYSMDPLDI
jgi:hypothetical protein